MPQLGTLKSCSKVSYKIRVITWIIDHRGILPPLQGNYFSNSLAK